MEKREVHSRLRVLAKSPRFAHSRNSLHVASGGARHAPRVSSPALEPDAGGRTTASLRICPGIGTGSLVAISSVSPSLQSPPLVARDAREARFNVAPACRRRGHHAGSASGGIREGTIVIGGLPELSEVGGSRSNVSRVPMIRQPRDLASEPWLIAGVLGHPWAFTPARHRTSTAVGTSSGARVRVPLSTPEEPSYPERHTRRAASVV
jgi:hypothetical protein